MKWKLSVMLLGAALLCSAPALAQQNTGTELNAVSSLSVHESDEGTYIRIGGTEVATFSVFKLDDPPRLFVDLSNSRLDREGLTEEIYNGVISRVGLMEFEDGYQQVARLVIGFEEAAHYDVRTEGSDVVVFVDGSARRQASPQPVATGVDEAELRQREEELAEARRRLSATEAQFERESQERRQAYDNALGDLTNTRSELEEARQELAAMRERRDAASGEERRQLEDAIAEQNRALEAAQRDVDSRARQVEELRGAMAELQQERDTERARLEEAQRRAAETEEAYREALALAERRGEESEEARRLAAEREEESRRAQRRAQELEERLSATRNSLTDLSAENEAAQARLAELGGEVERSQSHLEEQQRELESARARESQLESQIAELRASARGADDSAALQALEEERRDLQRQQREREEELSRAQRDAQQVRAQLDEARQSAQSAERDLAAAQEESRQAQADLRQARRDAERAEAELASVMAQVGERDEEIARLRRSLQESQQARQELERAASDAERAASEAERAASAADQRAADVEREAEERERSWMARAARAVPVDPIGENAIRGVRLETGDDGYSRIVVDLDRPGHFETVKDQGRAVMIFNNVSLPEHLEQTLSADAEGGAVRFLSSYAAEDGRVRVEADLSSDASEVIRQEGNRVVWEFAPTVAQPAGQLAADYQPQRPTDGESVTSNPPNYPRVVSDPTQVNTVPGMSRQRITIDLRSADIENVLRLISSESGVNIIAGSDVSGAVTMRLRSVPLDQAFLTILQSLQLGFEVRGNVIRVAPQSVLNDEQAARAEARARAQAVEPLEVFLLPINYASASDLTTQVTGLLSPRGSVSVDDRTNTLIIKDLRDNLTSIRMLIETLDAQVPQVLIEARIVETNDNFTRQIGIQWGGDVAFAQGSGNPTGLIFPNVLGLAGGATDGQAPTAGTSDNPNFAVNLPAATGTGSGGALGLTLGSVGGAVNLNLRLSALEDAGHAKIISSPRILTLDNRQATISQGTSIPISVVGAAGVQTVFVDATLELTVTPHVTPDGNIRLSIQATKNEPDFQNTGARGDPTVIRNEAQTELLIKDGDTTVIGGIYSQNTGHSVSGVPFLHRIPILRFFFRTQSQTENRQELLIFITPRIVNRAEALGVMSAGTLEGDVSFSE